MEAPNHHYDYSSIWLSVTLLFGRLVFGFVSLFMEAKNYFPALQDITKEAFMAFLFFAVGYVCSKIAKYFERKFKRNAKN